MNNLEEHGNAIIVWDSDHIPDIIKEVMDVYNIRDDDLDWVAFVPPMYAEQYIGWLESPSFGCCSVEHYMVGDVAVYFGYHS